MWTLANTLSIARIPLAFAFLQDNSFLRVLAIACALLTDGLDGYFARREKNKNQFGKVLDPLMDKFFVIFVLTILLREHSLDLWKVVALLCRDFSVLFFGIYLILSGLLSTYSVRAIWCGKITTVLQLLVLTALTLHLNIPGYLFNIFFVLGFLAMVELYYVRQAYRHREETRFL